MNEDGDPEDGDKNSKVWFYKVACLVGVGPAAGPWFWSVQGCAGAGSGGPGGAGSGGPGGVEEQESQATAAENTLHHHQCVEHRRQPGSGQQVDGPWDPHTHAVRLDWFICTTLVLIPVSTASILVDTCHTNWSVLVYPGLEPQMRGLQTHHTVPWWFRLVYVDHPGLYWFIMVSTRHTGLDCFMHTYWLTLVCTGLYWFTHHAGLYTSIHTFSADPEAA